MVKFLRTLKEMGDDLWLLVFVNNGAKLTIDSSEILEDLKAYDPRGLKSWSTAPVWTISSYSIERKQVGEDDEHARYRYRDATGR